jgi:Icc-related predicted phosphoesterase
MRLLVTSDLHASEVAWRKLLNAVRLGIWKVDAVLVAGDLSGKALVPLVRSIGGWHGSHGGREWVARNDDELREIERALADKGLYAVAMTGEELAELDDPHVLEQRFLDAIKGRLEAWMELAGERLHESATPLYLIPGNDDPYDIDPVLEGANGVINADNRVVRLPDGRELIGFATANPTPWLTPRELEEEELEERLRALVASAEAPGSAVLMTHVPPHASAIDTVAKLDEELRPVMSGGKVVEVPCGSTAVRHVIEQFQPVLSVHGHVHESPGQVRVGSTLCVNAGSEAAVGILRACLIDIDSKGVRTQRVEG